MGILGRLFGKKERLLEPADISRLKVDLHSHLIPDIDDGSQTIEDSMDMIRRLHEMGYRKVITTPHVMSDFYKNTPEIILNGLDLLKGAIKAEKLDMEIEASAEYYLDDMFEDLLERDEILPFGGAKKYLLFELPFVGEPANMSRAIFNMQLKGYRPILAHPERYGYWERDFDKYDELHDKGVLLQLNLNSLSGYYGPEAKRASKYLIEKGMVSFLGTDCHRMDHLDVYSKITCKTHGFHELLDSGRLLNDTL